MTLLRNLASPTINNNELYVCALKAVRTRVNGIFSVFFFFFLNTFFTLSILFTLQPTKFTIYQFCWFFTFGDKEFEQPDLILVQMPH